MVLQRAWQDRFINHGAPVNIGRLQGWHPGKDHATFLVIEVIRPFLPNKLRGGGGGAIVATHPGAPPVRA
jgi:hypothetical protein